MSNTAKELIKKIEKGDQDANFELAEFYFSENCFDEAEEYFLAYKNYLFDEDDYIPIVDWYLGKIYLSDRLTDYFRAGYYLDEYRKFLKTEDENTFEVNDLIKKHFDVDSLPTTRRRNPINDKKRLKENSKFDLPQMKALLGDIYFEEGDYKKALGFCLESKICLTSKFNLGIIYYYGSENIQKNYKLSKEFLLQCKKTYCHANLILGYIYAKGDSDNNVQQNFKLAIKCFSKVQKDYYEANYYLGRIYSEQKNYKEAIKYFTQCLGMSDENENIAEVHYRIGKIYQTKDKNLESNKDGFLEHMRQAVEYQHKEACEELIDYYKNKNDELNCDIYKEKLGKIQSAQEFADSYKLGLYYYKKNDYTNAVKSFESAIQEKNTEAYFALGCIFYKLKSYDLSIDNFNQYLSNEEKTKKCTGLAHHFLADIYEQYSTNNEINRSKVIYHYAQASLVGNKSSYQKLIAIYEDIQQDFDKFGEVYELSSSTYMNEINNKNEINYWLAHVNNRLLKDKTLQTTIEAPAEQINLKQIESLFAEAEASGHAKARYELAQLLMEHNDVDRAKSYYETFIKNSQTYDASLFVNACIVLAKLHHANTLKGSIDNTQADLKQAILWCKKAIEKIEQKNEYQEAKKLLDRIKYQLMTGLLYEALRHCTELKGNKVDYNIDVDDCKPYRELLEFIDPSYKNYDANQFSKELEKAERENSDFFGTNLSDDSDSEEEINYKKISNPIKQSSLIHCHGLFKKAALSQAKEKLNEVITRGKKFNKEVAILKPNFKIGRTASSNERIEEDLKELNYWKNQNQLDRGLKRITTKFVIAQYRGIHYKVSAWSQVERQKHRKLDEIGKPIFSSAVYQMAGISYVEEIDQATQATLMEYAKQLKVKLMALQDTGPYLAPFKHYKEEKRYKFPSVRHYLHDLHAKDYDKFHVVLAENVKHIEQTGKPIIPRLDIKFTTEPFVATGDTPLHALKYAYGIKSYEGHHHERLRPRWNKEGRAERPYSGKFYLSLHPVSDYVENGPFHMVSENHLSRVRIDSTKGQMIMQERETSFPAYLEAGRIDYTHVAKYPSFKGDYKEIYAGKYGLDKDLYELFKKAITKFPPHSDEMEMIKILLGEYLCHYHQVRLAEQASFVAEQQGKVLIYLDQFGNFSLRLPSCTPPTIGKGRKDLNELRQQRHQRPLTLESDEVQEPPHKKMRK